MDQADGDDRAEDWYENNLQLAAELGKALLERNRELEGQLMYSQQSNEDQQQEIEHLNHQLDILRESVESKNHIYEEIDKALQELEKTNQKFVIDSKADKQKIERLTDHVQTLEEKNEDLSRKVEDLKVAERERKKMQKQQNKDTRRARSLANLPDNKENRDLYYEKIGNWTYSEGFKNQNLPLNPYEVEIRNLNDVLKKMKAQNMLDKRKREDMETEVALLWEENTSLELRIKILEDDLIKYQKLQDEIHKMKHDAVKFCGSCGKNMTGLKKKPLVGDLEDDEPKFNSEGKIVKMESGGSVYGSRESLDQVAMETKETMTQIETPDDPTTAGISILNEIECQYQALFERYELLIQKGKRPSSLLLEDDEKAEEELEKRLASKAVQTTVRMPKPGTATDEAENPPYKMIFRDIFATLKKSRIEESGETCVTSPETTRGKVHSASGGVPDAR